MNQTSWRLVVLAEGQHVVDEDVPDLVGSVQNRAVGCRAQLCDLPFRLRTGRWVVFGTVTGAHWKGHPYIYMAGQCSVVLGLIGTVDQLEPDTSKM